MSTLKFADVHNLVTFLSKPTKSEGFEQIVDFLSANPIKYALTVNPTIYTSCIEQFWATGKVKTVNGETQLQALVDIKKVIITESSVRRDLQLKVAEGVDCLPYATIFEQLTLMGMVKNLDNVNKFLMYPRVGKDFSRRETPIFPTMMVQAQGEIESVVDEAVNEEMNDCLERDATTATSLDVDQDRGGGPRRQDTLGDAIAQTRSERVSKISNDPLLAGVNTPRSGKDSLKLNELMELYTKLQQRVLDLEVTKTTQALEIDSLKRRVKKLERRKRSRTHGLKRLYKFRLSARIESSEDEGLGEEDASKQGRKIHDIDVNENITLVNDQDDQQMFDADKNLQGEDVIVESVDVAEQAKEVVANKDIIDDINLAKALMEIKKEQEELTDAEKTELFVQFLEKKRKYFAAKRAEEKRNIPPIRAQQRSIMCTYLKNMERYKLNSLKNKSFVNIQELFDKPMKRVNTVVDYRAELVEDSSKKAEAEVTEGSSKRAGEELEQENAKKQKMEDNKESAELKQCLEIILDDKDDVNIDATPLSSNKMLKNFDREDLEVIYRLVKARFEKVKPMDHMDSFLLHNLKTVFEHHVKDNNILYYLLVEKMYPLTNHTLHQMFNDVKLQVNYECDMAYELLRLVKKQLKEGYVP
nr:hypothetical protein [Tanacetum cinerariifolium]